jgi:hypothetical protein
MGADNDAQVGGIGAALRALNAKSFERVRSFTLASRVDQRDKPAPDVAADLERIARRAGDRRGKRDLASRYPIEKA